MSVVWPFLGHPDRGLEPVSADVGSAKPAARSIAGDDPAQALQAAIRAGLYRLD